jgi:DNA-binding NarL/FixJ family response regulator
MRILIAHGDDLVLAGLRLALAADEGFEIAAEAHDALTLVPLVGQTTPEVVLLDVDFPGIGGIEGLRRLRAGHPDLKVVMSGGPASRDVIEDALAEGACGYIVDRMSASDVGAAILQAVDSDPSPETASGELPGWAAGFTPREAAVLEAVARGLPNKAIARELQITERTVKFHLTTVYRKLGVSNRTEAARWALTQKIAA